MHGASAVQARQMLSETFVSLDGFVAPAVKGLVGRLAFGVRVDVSHGFPHAAVKARLGAKARHGAAQLLVVKHSVVAFIAQKGAAPLGVEQRQGFAGDVAQLGLHAQGLAREVGDLVPGQALVARDVKAFAQRLRVAHEPLKGHGKVSAMGYRP